MGNSAKIECRIDRTTVHTYTAYLSDDADLARSVDYTKAFKNIDSDIAFCDGVISDLKNLWTEVVETCALSTRRQQLKRTMELREGVHVRRAEKTKNTLKDLRVRLEAINPDKD
jgi:hypothetical protein